MKFKDYVYLSIFFIILYGAFHILEIGCPIRFLTGISCAGCGMTRAWLSIIKLDVRNAFYYHPLFWIPPLVVGIVLFKNKISKKSYSFLIIFISVIFITVYVIRILNPTNTVVEININNGVIWRIFNDIIEGRY